MHLNEQLKICLLALACRYPKSVIEIDEMVLGHHVCQIDAFAPELELEWLQVYAPQLLQSPAYLVIDPQQSAVYLLELSRDIPAFWIYCDGCSPAQRKKTLYQHARKSPAFTRYVMHLVITCFLLLFDALLELANEPRLAR